MSTRDELQDLRNLLGEQGFIDAIWTMRERAMGPLPKPYLKGWKWKRPNTNNILPFKGEMRHGVRGAKKTKS